MMEKHCLMHKNQNHFQPHEVSLEIQGKTICHYFHFEMSFESGNLHVCGYETTDGAGVLTLMGISQHALKWNSCNDDIRKFFKNIQKVVFVQSMKLDFEKA